jgi:hypothetical protein
LPILDDHRIEISIFIDDNDHISYRDPIISTEAAEYSILINFSNIQALFNSDNQLYSNLNDNSDNESISSIPCESHFINVNIYLLAFLKTIGNLQANEIPSCFYLVVVEVN